MPAGFAMVCVNTKILHSNEINLWAKLIYTQHTAEWEPVTSTQYLGNGEIWGVLHSGASEIGVEIVTTTKDCLKKYHMERHVGKGLLGKKVIQKWIASHYCQSIKIYLKLQGKTLKHQSIWNLSSASGVWCHFLWEPVLLRLSFLFLYRNIFLIW